MTPSAAPKTQSYSQPYSSGGGYSNTNQMSSPSYGAPSSRGQNYSFGGQSDFSSQPSMSGVGAQNNMGGSQFGGYGAQQSYNPYATMQQGGQQMMQNMFADSRNQFDNMSQQQKNAALIGMPEPDLNPQQPSASSQQAGLGPISSGTQQSGQQQQFAKDLFGNQVSVAPGSVPSYDSVSSMDSWLRSERPLQAPPGYTEPNIAGMTQGDVLRMAQQRQSPQQQTGQYVSGPGSAESLYPPTQQNFAQPTQQRGMQNQMYRPQQNFGGYDQGMRGNLNNIGNMGGMGSMGMGGGMGQNRRIASLLRFLQSSGFF